MVCVSPPSWLGFSLDDTYLLVFCSVISCSLHRSLQLAQMYLMLPPPFLAIGSNVSHAPTILARILSLSLEYMQTLVPVVYCHWKLSSWVLPLLLCFRIIYSNNGGWDVLTELIMHAFVRSMICVFLLSNWYISVIKQFIPAISMPLFWPVSASAEQLVIETLTCYWLWKYLFIVWNSLGGLISLVCELCFKFSDTLVRQAAMVFKCILLIYYKNSRGRNYRKQVRQ